jgi:hypothetical protein
MINEDILNKSKSSSQAKAFCWSISLFYYYILCAFILLKNRKKTLFTFLLLSILWELSIMLFFTLELTYLLYRTISGSQMCSDGTYSSVTPPYSTGSHLNLWSCHSCSSQMFVVRIWSLRFCSDAEEREKWNLIKNDHASGNSISAM